MQVPSLTFKLIDKKSLNMFNLNAINLLEKLKQPRDRELVHLAQQLEKQQVPMATYLLETSKCT